MDPKELSQGIADHEFRATVHFLPILMFHGFSYTNYIWSWESIPNSNLSYSMFVILFLHFHMTQFILLQYYEYFMKFCNFPLTLY